MIKVIRKIPQVHHLGRATPIVGHLPGTAATSFARALAFHWHLDPMTRRPIMHWVSADARAVCRFGAAR